eukprot:2020492-Rhodomonas_salina.1
MSVDDIPRNLAERGERFGVSLHACAQRGGVCELLKKGASLTDSRATAAPPALPPPPPTPPPPSPLHNHLSLHSSPPPAEKLWRSTRTRSS